MRSKTNSVADVVSRVEQKEQVEMVGIEVIPVGSNSDACDGVVVRLIRGEGTDDEVALSAGLGPAQCREIARRLLIAADAASRGTERTVLCVTSQEMWKMPGQTLIVRCTPDVHYEFAVKPSSSGRAGNGHRKLITPPRGLIRTSP